MLHSLLESMGLKPSLEVRVSAEALRRLIVSGGVIDVAFYWDHCEIASSLKIEGYTLNGDWWTWGWRPGWVEFCAGSDLRVKNRDRFATGPVPSALEDLDLSEAVLRKAARLLRRDARFSIFVRADGVFGLGDRRIHISWNDAVSEASQQAKRIIGLLRDSKMSGFWLEKGTPVGGRNVYGCNGNEPFKLHVFGSHDEGHWLLAGWGSTTDLSGLVLSSSNPDLVPAEVQAIRWDKDVLEEVARALKGYENRRKEQGEYEVSLRGFGREGRKAEHYSDYHLATVRRAD